MPIRPAVFLLVTASLFPMAVQAAEAPAPRAVLTAYGDLAHAMYGDALATAQRLDAAIDALLAEPGETTLQAARDAWRAARVPYQQTEAFRFGNAVVDDWEGRSMHGRWTRA
jgi:putative iron-regulated protein